MDISVQEISSRLVSDYGYKERDALSIAREVHASTLRVQASFEKWWQTGELDSSLSVQGYTPQRLVDEYAFTPANAIVSMDWLLRDPEGALLALRRGFDTIRSEESK